FVNSGTEATMSAIRVARAFTGRDKIVKFEGCYHGHSDGLLAKAGSGVATLGLPDSAGVPAPFTAETLVVPVPANMGLVPPADGFLQFLHDVTHRAGALLIFDEVISGFRIASGGAQM